MEKDENPAEWMLDVTGATPSSNNRIPWVGMWLISKEREMVRSDIDRVREKGQKNAQIAKSSAICTNAAPYVLQFRLQTRRLFQEYWRTPAYIYSKLALCAGVVSTIMTRFLSVRY